MTMSFEICSSYHHQFNFGTHIWSKGPFHLMWRAKGGMSSVDPPWKTLDSTTVMNTRGYDIVLLFH